ncbi:hypothetical protein K458DRAFT_112179 [Lentithecium fluviatile CBS 122367]|uniref:Zn(2)-C6 fungal-type domain-containing protein n=1 Tax=Lentithecium fluviatile CBS 122367 TaxID=1168545 RepID=A0A6G1INU7_9PLEO|nr:hypothetical protein K458DRAFT_112179 [Lentithecium fluviatile CBS 122367]
MSTTNIMAPKRPSDDNLTSQAAKLPKIEPGIAASPLLHQHGQLGSPQNDFSGSVKKKLASSSRTGQACDRCKIRKIRCDPRPEGCSPCAQNRTPCKTTDRITGKATTRGHTEAMEAENNYLRAQIAEMQAQLKEMGVEPRAPSGYNSYAPPSATWPPSGVGNEWEEPSQRRTSLSPLPGYAPAGALESSGPLPQFKTSSFGDNYLGMSSSDSLLSNIKGTSLSVFGHEIDITDFIQNEQDYDTSVMSYNHVIKVALGEDRVDPVPFPPYPILSEYCTWYLRSLNPYTMLQDKPTLMKLVWRIGNEPHFTPSAAETVSIHMLIATLKYQISVRNQEAAVLEESHRHYRYALSFFNQLLLGHTWEDVQAMAMISHHLRNFPKPGAAWMMISVTFLLAIELGFHRSTKAWADTVNKMDQVEIEMRKRIFWTLMALATSLSGKLGRPMPISVDNIDVEFPEPLNDCLPGEDLSLTPYRKCSFIVGIHIAKFTVWLAKLYGSLYTVNPTSRDYDDTLLRLEAGIRQWKDELPPELNDPARASQDNYIFALYLEYWHHEYRLLLHHPAVCRSKDPEIINSNLDKCLSASQSMLRACTEMKKFRSLDIPWVNAVAQIAAIFTTLFIHFQRKDQMSSADMTKLSTDMVEWIDLMGEWGQLLGSGDKLKQAIHKIVERSLSGINESIFKRTASQSLAQVALQGPPETSATAVYSNGNHQGQYTNAASSTADAGMSASSQAYAGVPVGAAYAYNNGAPASVPQQNTGGFEHQPYGPGQESAMAPSHAAALQAAASNAANQRPEDAYAYSNAQVATNGHQPNYSTNSATLHEWHQFAKTYMQQVTPQGEYLNTATTLMALGGREGGGTQGPGVETTGVTDNSVVHAWPGVQFGLQTNGHIGQ